MDIDPETGRARFSYRRAEEIFHAATGDTLVCGSGGPTKVGFKVDAV